MIVFVFNPYELLGETPPNSDFRSTLSQQHENLLILKRLPGLKLSPDPLPRTYFYVSHADIADQKQVDEAKRLIISALSEMGESVKADRIVTGASVIEIEGRLAFPTAPNSLREPRDLITGVMSTFAAKAISPRLGTWHIPNFLTLKTLGIALLLCLIFAVPTWWWIWPQYKQSQQWKDHFSQLKQFEKDTAEATYEKAERLLDQLMQWEERSRNEFPNKYAPDIEQNVQTLRTKLKAIQPPPPPPGWTDLVNQVKELRSRNGPDLKRFYEQLKETAARERSIRKWPPKVLDEWTELEQFATDMLSGIRISLGESWLSTPYFWTRATGAGTLQLEIWVAGAGSPKPFDADTDGSESAAIVGLPVDYTENGEKYNYTWRNGVERPSNIVHIGDQVWIRIFHKKTLLDDAQYFDEQVPLLGPTLLGWFNRELHKSVNGQQVAFWIRINAKSNDGSRDIAIPSSLDEAFAQ